MSSYAGIIRIRCVRRTGTRFLSAALLGSSDGKKSSLFNPPVNGCDPIFLKILVGFGEIAVPKPSAPIGA